MFQWFFYQIRLFDALCHFGKWVYGILKRVVWYFEDGCKVLWRVVYGILKRVEWYFEEGCTVLWRVLYVTLNMFLIVIWRQSLHTDIFLGRCCNDLYKVAYIGIKRHATNLYKVAHRLL